ncbi:GBS Bsp-like repeat-containing protein [Streptococcus pluranimalium]
MLLKKREVLKLNKRFYKSKKQWILASITFAGLVLTPNVLAEDANTTAVSSSWVDTNNEPTVLSDLESLQSVFSTTIGSSIESSEIIQSESNFSEVSSTAVMNNDSDGQSELAPSSEAFSNNEVATKTEKITVGNSLSASVEAANRLTSARTFSAPVTSENVKASQTNPTVAENKLVTATVSDKQISIQYHADKAVYDKVQFAVWGDDKGQNDLVWYTADNTGAAFVELSKHKEYGQYHIHTYGTKSGKMVGLNAMSIEVLKPQVNASVTKLSNGNYNVVVTNVPNDIVSIKVPVWSENNGQDDIIWYNATKTNDSTFVTEINTNRHKNDSGNYQAHIYGISSVTGGLIGLTTTSFINTVTSIQKANATVSVTNYSETKSEFNVNVIGNSNTKTIKSVSIAAWSEKNGQDDLKWYKPTVSNNKATATINIKDLSDTNDNYIVHVYTDYTDGSRVGTNLGTYRITKPQDPVASTSVTVSPVGQNKYSVTISNVPKNVSAVTVPIWSSDKGQDDLKWYSAVKQSNGDYKATFELVNHSNNIGTYYVHVYGKTIDGLKGLLATTYQVNDLEITKKAIYQKGQLVEIQSFATNDSTGKNLVNYQGKIGTVTNISKNTFNSIGGWEYSITYSDGSISEHVLEQDLRYVYQVALNTNNTSLENNRALQQAFHFAKTHKGATLYLPKGNFVVGSNISETDLGNVSADNYIILSSDTKLRGHDKGTTLQVDGTMLWFGLPTGKNPTDGVSNLTIDNINVIAKDLVNGDYFMVQMNHGNNIVVKNSSFTMVQRVDRHIFDLGGVQNATFTNNKFVGYAPSLTSVKSYPSGDLHSFYAEAIQLDRSNNQGSWDANMIKRLSPVDYINFNAQEAFSNNIVISNNRFLPYYSNGKILAYAATIGQHSSQVGNVTVTNNYFEKLITKRFTGSETWVMEAVHMQPRKGSKHIISGNVVV